MASQEAPYKGTQCTMREFRSPYIETQDTPYMGSQDAMRDLGAQYIETQDVTSLLRAPYMGTQDASFMETKNGINSCKGTQDANEPLRATDSENHLKVQSLPFV